MSIGNLLNHTCDIYHLTAETASVGWGLPATPQFQYGSAPDIAGQACHFGIKNRIESTKQTAPANNLESRKKLILPIEVDVRLNDKIVDCKTGLEYTAEHPVNVRNHHIFVWIKRTEKQQAL